ncbi:MAG: hypothetical protein R8G66_24935 [Cytophagales bacterium]|nr:hypothetical protein [Cytophagales bacterium]
MKRIAILAFLLIIGYLSNAQETDSTSAQLIRVNLKNKEVYVGSIVSQDASILVLKTAGGEINVPTSQIESVDYLDEMTDTRFRYPNPNETRYFFAPTAIPLKQGEGYYQNVLLSSNFVNFGLTDHFSVGGGLELVSTFLGQPIFFLTPKWGYQTSEKIYVGAGMLVVLPNGGGQFLLPYGVTTFGTTESNMSISLGIPFVEGDADNGGLVSVSGFHRFSTSFALLSENYFLPFGESDLPYFGIQGVRIIGKKNSFDLGLIVTDTTPIPYVSYVRKF